jgi:hypothetical protein
VAGSSALTKRGSTRRWRRIRAHILRRDGGVCQYCGAPATTVDHVVPRAGGGGGGGGAYADHPSNLVAACSDCNRRKSSRSAAVFSAGEAPDTSAPCPLPPHPSQSETNGMRRAGGSGLWRI